MKRKIIVLLPILLFIPIFLWAAGGQDIAATTKLKGVIKDGVQIVAKASYPDKRYPRRKRRI